MTTVTTKRSPPQELQKLESAVVRKKVTVHASVSFLVLSRREWSLLRGVWSASSHSSWKSLFLYLCFNEITFGPLKSQGIPLSSLSVGKGKDTVEALSCSPKSLYHLSQLVGCICCSIVHTQYSPVQLGLDRLADLAFHDIINKLNSENIVGELFSKSTAR
ncbi:hypothetical protein BJ322DRAFT_1087489 [Thelephora terrestris]|jgi:hypothetical protein|uniref:Uncharacterized protein n=1 Tax=Thelephora terrestris TaxID=56493 RepID=A0A9P6H532_9AGAM|nr:hypothetical protein BJ322DRAFT_1087489 [Thelephora terrestris]